MAQPLPPVGIDRLIASPDLLARLRGRRVGMLSNETALARDWRPSAHVLAEALGDGLVRLFVPEHGWSGALPEGAGVADAVEPTLGLPIVSLYGGRRAPGPGLLADLDALVIDLPDAGVRCFTYAATAALLLRAVAAAGGPEVILCDRPNPLGPAARGPVLDPRYRSLVGFFDVPFQHGMTIGGLVARDNADQPNGGAALTVVPADGAASGPWIPPSPALPSRDAALLYPGLVLLEGTNVSEGRGTALPFQCVAAPGLDGAALARRLNALEGTGIAARPIGFVPATGKLAGRPCTGVQLHVLAPERLESLALGVRLLALLRDSGADFVLTTVRPGAWQMAGAAAPSEPYWLDHLIGSPALRLGLETGATAEAILSAWLAPP